MGERWKGRGWWLSSKDSDRRWEDARESRGGEARGREGEASWTNSMRRSEGERKRGREREEREGRGEGLLNT